MAVLDYIYKNAALDQTFDDASDFVTIGAPNGSTDYAVFYIGTPTSGNQLQDASNPGVDSIEVSIVDSASGSGVEAANIKLALDPADFGTTTAGAALNVATTITHAVPAAVYVQFDNDVLSGTNESTEISLSVSAMVESAS